MKIFKLFLLAAIMLPFATFAATQGTLGSTSTGVIGITAGSAQPTTGVKISDLSDVTMSDPNQTGLTSACIYASTGTFGITLSDNSGAAGFRLKPTVELSHTPLQYTATLHLDASANVVFNDSKYNIPQTLMTTNTTEPDCTTISPNAGFFINVVDGTPEIGEVYETDLTIHLQLMP